MIMPKPLSAQLEASKYRLFSEDWVDRPDDLGVFPTNGDRYVAEELWRTANLRSPPYQGFLLQGLAASWHYMSKDRLRAVGEAVKNILVMTGTGDNMIEHFHTDVIVDGLESAGRKVEKIKFEGAGHCLHWEVREYNAVIEKFVLDAQD
jgi:pimeloyl-ACP methyl ester carboxylesterase